MPLNVGELSASFGLDDAEFNTGLDTMETSFGGFAGTLAKIAGGVALGAILTEGFNQHLDIGAGSDVLAAQLRLTEDQADTAGRIAADVYSNAWGDSMGDVERAIEGVQQNMGGLGEVSDDTFTTMTTNAIDVAKIMEEDVQRVTRAAGTLLKTDLAGDATEAFDIITAGQQAGLDVSEEWLDTLFEYAEPIASLGLDGPEAIALFSRGLDEGAFNLDKVGDALKEFAIRAVDGSVASGEAYAALGLDAEDMGLAILSGGENAESAMSTIIQALMAMEDPLAQDAAGVALFGTMWEDLGPQVIAALDPASIAVEGITGRTEEMSDVLNSNGRTTLTMWRRQVEMAMVRGLGSAISVVKSAVGWLREHDDIAKALAIGIGVALVPAFVGLAAAAWAAITPILIAAAPFLAVAAAITALTLGIMWLIDNWGVITDFVTGFLSTVGEIPGLVLDALGNVGSTLLDKGKELLQGLFDGVEWVFDNLVYRYFVGIPMATAGAIGDTATSLFWKGWDLISGLAGGAGQAFVDLLQWWFVGIPWTVVGLIGDTAATLYTKGWNLMVGMKNGLIEKFNDVRAWIGGILGRVWTALGDTGNHLWAAGWNLLVGFLNGLKAKAASVIRWVEDFVSNVIKKVLDPLGILSPSTVFMEIGGNVMAGLEIGLDEGSRGVLDTMSDISLGIGSVIPAASVTPTAVGASSVSNRSTNQTFNITGVGSMAEWRREERRARRLARIRSGSG